MYFTIVIFSKVVWLGLGDYELVKNTEKRKCFPVNSNCVGHRGAVSMIYIPWDGYIK